MSSTSTEWGGEGDPHPFYLRPVDDVTKWDLRECPYAPDVFINKSGEGRTAWG